MALRVPRNLAIFSRPRRRLLLAGLLGLCLTVAASVIFWRPIAERFGPMHRCKSQCLVCQRQRIETSLCGVLVEDRLIGNEYSDWIDSFTAPHAHVWLAATIENRTSWFGGTSFACGGTPVLAEIYRRRPSLGEPKARALVARLHKLVQSPGFKPDLKRLDAFEAAVVSDPDSLLTP